MYCSWSDRTGDTWHVRRGAPRFDSLIFGRLTRAESGVGFRVNRLTFLVPSGTGDARCRGCHATEPGAGQFDLLDRPRQPGLYLRQVCRHRFTPWTVHRSERLPATRPAAWSCRSRLAPTGASASTRPHGSGARSVSDEPPGPRRGLGMWSLVSISGLGMTISSTRGRCRQRNRRGGRQPA